MGNSHTSVTADKKIGANFRKRKTGGEREGEGGGGREEEGGEKGRKEGGRDRKSVV